MTQHGHKGFTLAELLIALAILAIIATFIIPKMLVSNAEQKKYAVFKEDLGIVSTILYSQHQLGNLQDNTGTCGLTQPTLAQLFTQTSGYVKASPNTLYYANGSSIYFFTGSFVDFIVDWNGDALPNTEGDDQIHIIMSCLPSGNYQTGRIVPYNTTSSVLYNQIY